MLETLYRIELDVEWVGESGVATYGPINTYHSRETVTVKAESAEKAQCLAVEKNRKEYRNPKTIIVTKTEALPGWAQ